MLLNPEYLFTGFILIYSMDLVVSVYLFTLLIDSIFKF